MPPAGVEPAPLARYGPKPYASANSATGANKISITKITLAFKKARVKIDYSQSINSYTSISEPNNFPTIAISPLDTTAIANPTKAHINKVLA